MVGVGRDPGDPDQQAVPFHRCRLPRHPAVLAAQKRVAARSVREDRAATTNTGAPDSSGVNLSTRAYSTSSLRNGYVVPPIVTATDSGCSGS